MTDRAIGPEEIWDRFVDALDRAGQAGSPAGVTVPTFATHALDGKQFGDLSKDDVKTLARIANALGRRGDTLITMWEDMQRRARPPRRTKSRRSPKS